ncbi:MULTISPECIES: type II secretion system minor pseudopilin GspK [Corallincola]|uniref:Type II secretion system protein K n=2 Tax=Corallincola TaxID=1775176 RepID=A0A368NMN0_9GAMM|nr:MULTISPECIES: type II secretion system minor pseudopilin GspK [Corallincola]RCU51143.1 general secretion pathway protein GspK [Corallincola holothuriorum]TAA46075.1 general secretion pathway protein GspK [Corallincola spongiicola]
MRSNHSPRRQRGVAIITVMLVVALAVIIAANMTQRLSLQMRRAENLIHGNQGLWYAIGAEQFAMKILIQGFKDDKDVVHLGQNWAQEGNEFPVEGGSLGGQIIDQQACFNLNSVAGPTPEKELKTRPPHSRMFQELLEGVGVDAYEAEQIAEALRDWLDADSIVSSSAGAEDSEYESMPVPYLAANSLMAHASELRTVRGITAEIYEKVRPYVCAVPENPLLRINVNTIKAEQALLLQAALTPRLTLSDAQDLINNRPKNGYETIDEFWRQPEVSGAGDVTAAQKESLTVNSFYFLLQAKTEVADVTFRLESLLKREQDNKLVVIRRQLGGTQ